MSDVMAASSINVTPAKAVRALTEACEMNAEMRRLEARISAIAKKRRARWLIASRGGITQVDIAETCGMSVPNVVREIRQARQETSDPALAAQLPTRRPART